MAPFHRLVNNVLLHVIQRRHVAVSQLQWIWEHIWCTYHDDINAAIIIRALQAMGVGFLQQCAMTAAFGSEQTKKRSRVHLQADKKNVFKKVLVVLIHT